jgi:hypothetical protein
MKSALELEEVNEFLRRVSGEETLYLIEEIQKKEKTIALDSKPNKKELGLEEVKFMLENFRNSKNLIK